jgi:GT2 family glycosyltransferase
VELSIIILHHNTPASVHNVLRSLEVALLPTQTEVLVINNGDKNGNVILKTETYNMAINWYTIPNRGFPNGQNFGVQKSCGQCIAVLNPDIIVDPQCIKHLLAHMQAEPQCGIATAQLRYASGAMQQHTRVFPTIWQIASRRLLPSKQLLTPLYDSVGQAYESVDWCTGALLLMRREDLQAVGNHDEQYFLFMSDIALCREMWQHNKRIDLVYAATAIHGERRLSAGNAWQMLRKKTGRIHIKDAYKYYKHYWNQSLPNLCPSKANSKSKIPNSKPLSS